MQKKYIKDHLRNVLVAHIHVRGSELHTLYHLSESDEIIYEQRDIPACWDYLAYGHIHKPQAINNKPHARYAGSIERLDYGERDDQKSVVLVDIGPGGRTGDPVCLPLNATPFYRVEILDPETDMQGLQDRYRDADRALVSYRLIYKPGIHNISRLTDELKKVFPRCYDRQIEVEGAVTFTDNFEAEASSRDVSGTVENYVQEQLADHRDREEVLELMRELLSTAE